MICVAMWDGIRTKVIFRVICFLTVVAAKLRGIYTLYGKGLIHLHIRILLAIYDPYSI